MNIRRKRKAQSIPLSAMGDIAFLLLVFYMATTMVTDQKPRDLPLPEVTAGVQSSPYPLIIYLDRELADKNAAFFFNKEIPVSQLASAVQLRAADAPARLRVYLNIQKNLPYRYMNQVIESLKDAGIRNLIITTRAAEIPRAPAAGGGTP